MRSSLWLDPGVLHEAPVLELHGWEAVAQHGGAALLRWRADALAATAQGVQVLESLDGVTFEQALVHVQRSKEATRWDLARAWSALAPGGRLVVQGENGLGAKSIIAALAKELGRDALQGVSRERRRLAVFDRGATDALASPAEKELALPEESGGGSLRTLPGVFSAGELDAGTQRLLAELARLQIEPPARILDLACGVGPFALAALRRWPTAHVTLLDADRVALQCARENLRRAKLGAQADVVWWDVSEPMPGREYDLVLVNPPFHNTRTTDVELGRKMVEAGARAVRTGGHMLVVANRRLPYEALLAPWGQVRHRGEERDGFKLLLLAR